MSLQRAISLLACLALMAPLAASAGPACGPGQHCPMAALSAEPAPCHGAAIQKDDCCVIAADAVPVEVAPVIGIGTPWIDDRAPAPRPELAKDLPDVCDASASTPLYRLFRTLLI